MSVVHETSGKIQSNALVCHCYQVSECEIRCTIDANELQSVEEVTLHTSAGGGCSACHCKIRRILAGLPARCRPIQICGGCGCSLVQCACEAA